MELDFILKKLKEQETWFQYSNLDVSLPAILPYIEEYFGVVSTRAYYFRSLMKEYDDKKVSKGMGLSLIKDDSVKNKVKPFLSEVIEIIEHDIEQKAKEHKANLEKEKRHQENLARFAAIPKPQTQPVMEQKPAPEPKVIYKTRLPFGMKPELFWSIIVAVVGLAYWAGLRLETYQIQKENSDLKEQIKKLEEDTTSKGNIIRLNNVKLNNQIVAKPDSVEKKLSPDTTKVLPNTSTNTTKKRINKQEPPPNKERLLEALKQKNGN